MKVKVCGINQTANLLAIDSIGVDFIGLNYYPKSKRFVTGDPEFIAAAKQIATPKVGVFVGESQQVILDYVKLYDLDYVQLHGDESSDYCKAIQDVVKVIKVFRVGEDFDFNQTQEFLHCDYLLFDTYTTEYGGSGKRFDWSLLNKYLDETKYLLAGGIKLEDAFAIQDLNYPNMAGVDLNSKFEIRPGVKSILQLEEFLKRVNTSTYDV